MAVELLKGAGINEVVGKGGAKVSVEELLKDAPCVGLYFSAHWCPPCRNFTPVLASFYNTLEEKMVIIFVSSDRDQGSFDGYFNEMPWHAVPFDNRDAKENLSQKYSIRGIPTLIVLGRDGSVKDANARGTVQSNGGATEIPSNWK